jgi:hypothetical protein
LSYLGLTMKVIEIQLRSQSIPTVLAERVWLNAGFDPIGETDLPLRDRKWRRYPLRAMKLGQHFFVMANGQEIEKLQNNISSCVGSVQRKTRRRFHQRRYRHGIRVWRVR